MAYSMPRYAGREALVTWSAWATACPVECPGKRLGNLARMRARTIVFLMSHDTPPFASVMGSC